MAASLHDELVAQLLEIPRDEWPALALEADVRLPTMAKIAYRQIAEPGLNKAERLLRVLGARKATQVRAVA
jgi:hypothetical protein